VKYKARTFIRARRSGRSSAGRARKKCGPLVSDLASCPVTSAAWPAECLRRLAVASTSDDTSTTRIWAEELTTATFGLADLHRWLDVLLNSHLTSLDFQARCREAFVYLFAAGYVVRGASAGQVVRAALPYLPLAPQPGSAQIFDGPYPPLPSRAATDHNADRWSLYSTLSTSASQLASMMFSETPTVPQMDCLSRHSITTRTRAAVPARALTTRTL